MICRCQIHTQKEKLLSGRGNSTCKGPEVRLNLAQGRERKMRITIAGRLWKRRPERVRARPQQVVRVEGQRRGENTGEST